MNYHSTYFGCDIFRNTEPGFHLRWTSYVDGLFVHADTLQGIKRMIKTGGSK